MDTLRYEGTSSLGGLAIGKIWIAGGHAMPDAPVILAADTLTMDDVLRIPEDNLLGVLTRRGAQTGHMAVLLCSMRLPWIFGVKVREDWQDAQAILDGEAGLLTLHPSEAELHLAGARQTAAQKEQESLQVYAGAPTKTAGGREARLLATIMDISQIHDALKSGAEGIGLFRSEFLFLQSDVSPDEDTQYWAYRTLVERMEGRRCVIRTLDVGSDKPIPDLELPREPNPGLGYRAIRVCLDKPDLFKTQLRALLRAAAHGPLSITYPLITSLEELRACKVLVTDCERELAHRGIPFGAIEQGVMIETPAAVMLSDELAREADFFCIGTNDLTQYTLAVDRQNPRMAHAFNAQHPAVLRMIRMAAESARRHGRRVCICGLLPMDTEITGELLHLGIHDFSVPPSKILPLRAKISSLP